MHGSGIPSCLWRCLRRYCCGGARALRCAQVAFLTLVFGGCQQYLAPSLAHAHAHLIREQGLTVEHFDMVLEHLGDALEELDAALHELAEPSVRSCPFILVALGFWERRWMPRCTRSAFSAPTPLKPWILP